MKTIKGSVWYRERILLPKEAVVRISLEDVARADAPSEIIAATTLSPRASPPFEFSLSYDPLKIHHQGRYTLRARIELEGRLLFTSTENIPAFGHGNKPIEILVSRTGDARIDSGASESRPDASLTETYWKLTELEGRAVIPGAGQKELHIILSSEGGHVHGFSGCNRFTGAYQLDTPQIAFGQLASTRMACAEGMEQEHRFLSALPRIVRFSLSGETLTFHENNGNAILRFHSVYME